MKVILKVNLYRKVCVIFSNYLGYHLCLIASTFKLLPSLFCSYCYISKYNIEFYYFLMY